ncbi:MAG TPA: hypothetical protein VGC42_18730 [Kofleriaceae bacterium]
MKIATMLITLGGLGLAACSTPVPQLIIGLSGSESQTCPSTVCEKVKLLCPAVMSIKILDPSKPDRPFLSQCTAVARDGSQDMCSLASVDLQNAPIPVQHLEVQVALYPATEILTDPVTQQLMCPDHIQFSSGTGFPVEQASPTTPSPALGGVGFYDPGDAKVEVTLGCTDLSAINTSCQPADLTSVSADVVDFDRHAFVTEADAPQLDVFVGEPQGVDDHYELPANALHLLPRQPSATGDTAHARWGDELSLKLTRFACAEVFQPVAQATPTVACKAVSRPPIGLRGAWIQRPQLTRLLDALGTKGFPPGGLTVGMVVDSAGAPVAKATVVAKSPDAPSTVMYLTDDSDSKFAPGSTGKTGIFLSADAPFGTEFSTSQGPAAATLLGFGGNIQDVVTVVILSPNGN